jgi:hypothetical protein
MRIKKIGMTILQRGLMNEIMMALEITTAEVKK